jgi:hypothetical protein
MNSDTNATAVPASHTHLWCPSGRCDTVLLDAEAGQVQGLLMRCAACGSYNATEP